MNAVKQSSPADAAETLTVELDGLDLADLLKPVLPFTSDDSILECVLVESSGDSLIATATNRYAIVKSRVRLVVAPPAGFSVLISRRRAKKLLARATTADGVPLTVRLTATPAALEVRVDPPDPAVPGFVRQWSTADREDFPSLSHLFAAPLVTARGGGGLGGVSIGSRQAAEIFKAAARRSREPVTCWVDGPTKPVLFSAGDFLALLMPMYRGSDRDLGREAQESWGPHLTALGPQAVAK